VEYVGIFIKTKKREILMEVPLVILVNRQTYMENTTGGFITNLLWARAEKLSY
jgi:hypothetical protein